MTGGESVPYLGCVSSNVCDLLSQLKVRTDVAAVFNLKITPRGSKTIFCNSAWMVKVGVVPLLLGLFALFVF